MNENSKKYTWRRLNPTCKQARLDFFLVSESLSQFVFNTAIIPGYRTAHSGILLNLKLTNNERGKGYWKFNNSLLKDQDYIQKVKETIEEVKCTYNLKQNNINDNENIKFSINDQLFLETLLMMIRGMTIKYSSTKKRRTIEAEFKLENEIKTLENEINLNFNNINEGKVLDLIRKKDQLSNIRKDKIEGVMLRSRCRYQDLGEKPTNYFFNLENRNFMSKVINKLVEEGVEYTNTKDILNCQKQFYSNLYKANEQLNDEDFENIVGENDNKLSDLESEKLEGEIAFKELGETLKIMKNGKSPGQDGFTVEFFKIFWIDLGYFILRSLNYGYRYGNLSVTQKQGVITCIPKPNKCR